MASQLYPEFSTSGSPANSRLQRLETGAQRIQRGKLRPTSGVYQRLPKSALAPLKSGVQILNLATSAVRKVGAVPPQSNTYGFAYVSTTTSITWYWDGTNGSKVLVIHRTDGSTFTVPTGHLAITGLTLNTTYYFLPFWNTNNLCNIGWVQGTAGSPQIALVLADTTNVITSPQYLMQQNSQANEPLTSSFMSAATTASGSGGGGGSPGCVMAGTEIEALGDLDFKIEVLSEFNWIHLELEDGRFLSCTLDHPLYHAVTGKIRADCLSVGDLVITDKGEQRLEAVHYFKKKCSKHKVTMPKGHLFWANGFLSHNLKPR